MSGFDLPSMMISDAEHLLNVPVIYASSLENVCSAHFLIGFLLLLLFTSFPFASLQDCTWTPRSFRAVTAGRARPLLAPCALQLQQPQ